MESKKKFEEENERIFRKEKAWSTEYLKSGNLEQALKAKREEEQRIKDELKRKEEEYKEEHKRIIKGIINVIDSRRGDEAHDSSNYFSLAQRYKSIPTAAKLFQELSEAEDSHQKKLLLMGNELERQLKQIS